MGSGGFGMTLTVRSARRPEGAGARWRCVVCLLAVWMIFAQGLPVASVSAAPTASYYSEETGHILGEPFLSYWVRRDGMNLLGWPISEPVKHSGRLTQYFQYGVLQEAENSRGSKSPRLVRARTGSELLAARHAPDRLVAGRRVGSERSAAAFAETARQQAEADSGTFARFLRRNGGEDRFGKALSAPYTTAEYRVQWFEFGRLQERLEDGSVSVAPVGVELAHLRGVDLAPVDRGGLLRLDPRRFREFKGDGTIPEAKGRFAPVRIVIPKISVDAPIERVGIIDGVMDTPKDPWNVGWYPDLSTPGERTNVTMAGHRDWWGIGPTVFWNLQLLAPGDKIYLIAKDGRGATYVVTETWEVDADANAGPIIGDVGYEALTLITCTGPFTGTEYLSRHIVRAERI